MVIYEWHEAEDDQKELQHFVVDGAPESAEYHVTEYDHCRNQHARVETPPEQEIKQLPHRVHGDPG
jgi:hypothetical protein